MTEEAIDFPCGAVIWATGWRPYDAAKIQPYGYDRIANVITGVELERLADRWAQRAKSCCVPRTVRRRRRLPSSNAPARATATL